MRHTAARLRVASALLAGCTACDGESPPAKPDDASTGGATPSGGTGGWVWDSGSGGVTPAGGTGGA